MSLHPQTRAFNIGKSGCLAMCYIYCAGIKPDNTKYFDLISKAIDNGLLSSDCEVLDAEKFIFFVSGKRCIVDKQPLQKGQVARIVNPTPVKYSFGTSGHWVVMSNGECVFNSLESSVCYNKGEATTSRVITWI